MSTLALAADERVADVRFSQGRLRVELRDGRTIIVPLAWYPRLQKATPLQRRNWSVAGGGFGIHWPDIDEDLSTEGLLRGSPSPEVRKQSKISNQRNGSRLAARRSIQSGARRARSAPKTPPRG